MCVGCVMFWKTIVCLCLCVCVHVCRCVDVCVLRNVAVLTLRRAIIVIVFDLSNVSYPDLEWWLKIAESRAHPCPILLVASHSGAGRHTHTQTDRQRNTDMQRQKTQTQSQTQSKLQTQTRHRHRHRHPTNAGHANNGDNTVCVPDYVRQTRRYATKSMWRGPSPRSSGARAGNACSHRPPATMHHTTHNLTQTHTHTTATTHTSYNTHTWSDTTSGALIDRYAGKCLLTCVRHTQSAHASR